MHREWIPTSTCIARTGFRRAFHLHAWLTTAWTRYGDGLGRFAVANALDGVDFDFEDTAAFQTPGFDGVAWVRELLAGL